jgi:hypothetical protein
MRMDTENAMIFTLRKLYQKLLSKEHTWLRI